MLGVVRASEAGEWASVLGDEGARAGVAGVGTRRRPMDRYVPACMGGTGTETVMSIVSSSVVVVGWVSMLEVGWLFIWELFLLWLLFWCNGFYPIFH